MRCPQCDGVPGLLGVLGYLKWFRCIDCGWEWARRLKRRQPDHFDPRGRPGRRK